MKTLNNKTAQKKVAKSPFDSALLRLGNRLLPQQQPVLEEDLKKC